MARSIEEWIARFDQEIRSLARPQQHEVFPVIFAQQHQSPPCVHRQDRDHAEPSVTTFRHGDLVTEAEAPYGSADNADEPKNKSKG